MSSTERGASTQVEQTKPLGSADIHPLIDAGLSLVPVSHENKRPLVPWKKFQSQLPEYPDVSRWLHEGFSAMALVCGKVSGGVEVIDIDANEAAGYPAEKLWVPLQAKLRNLLDRHDIPVWRTGGGGFQFAYRCPTISGNQKLAWVPDDTQHQGRSIAIETRGNGGYAIIPPSTHPAGTTYELISGDLRSIPIISEIERMSILDAARSLNLVDIDPSPSVKAMTTTANGAEDTTSAPPAAPRESVIRAYNKKNDIGDILRYYGYTDSHSGRLSRPGQKESAGVTIDEKENVSYHWSSNDPLHSSNTAGNPRPQDPFNVYMEYEHHGDVTAAVRAAAEQLDMKGVAPQEELVWPEGKKTQGIFSGINPLSYRAQDGGIGDALSDACKDDWIYFHGYNRWHQWSGTHWELDKKRDIEETVNDLLDWMNRGAATFLQKIEESSARGEVTKKDLEQQAHARKMHNAAKYSKSRASSVLERFKNQQARASEDIGQENLLNLKNGILDLETLSLLPHDRRKLFTYCLPYEYDEQATCPTWEKAIKEILIKPGTDETDEQLVHFIQEYMFYTLTNDTRYEKMVWLYGEGGAGKSTIVETMQALLGDESLVTVVDFSQLGHSGNYSLSEMPGKRMIFSTEGDGAEALKEGIIKQLVSGETINARPIYGRDFQFKPTAKLWWSMNDRPSISDKSDGMWRRMTVIPFSKKLSSDVVDIDMKDKLRKELPGILNWAIVGGKRLRKARQFTQSDTSNAAKQAYREEENPVLQWVNTCCEITPWPEARPTMLYEAFDLWCQRTGNARTSNRKFFRELSRLDIPYVMNDGKRYSLRIIKDNDTNDTF